MSFSRDITSVPGRTWSTTWNGQSPEPNESQSRQRGNPNRCRAGRAIHLEGVEGGRRRIARRRTSETVVSSPAGAPPIRDERISAPRRRVAHRMKRDWQRLCGWKGAAVAAGRHGRSARAGWFAAYAVEPAQVGSPLPIWAVEAASRMRCATSPTQPPEFTLAFRSALSQRSLCTLSCTVTGRTFGLTEEPRGRRTWAAGSRSRTRSMSNSGAGKPSTVPAPTPRAPPA